MWRDGERRRRGDGRKGEGEGRWGDKEGSKK